MNTRVRPLSLKESGMSEKSFRFLLGLKTHAKIQDFINQIPFNFETNRETYMSPQKTMEHNTAHCFEGALLAALIMWVRGERPLLLDLKAESPDVDHVVAIFNDGGFWGAISKTNHAVLRYREPIYKNIRELAMSYFHEYFLANGIKTMRSFSTPFDLSKVNKKWITTDRDLYGLMNKLDRSPHTRFISKRQIKNLRKADQIEIKAGEVTER
ncbi:MAG: hypothetical protein AB200_03205 [Parcubacteria bacterium C7867-005]|nr:MAG: hypothetical protein AB200_03205 [Parcubacteria bacterium C7867-005]